MRVIQLMLLAVVVTAAGDAIFHRVVRGFIT